MAVDRLPTAPWPGYATAGTPVDHITLSLADLPGLTAANAETATGDWPAVVLAIMQGLFDHYNGLATADKPKGMVVAMTPATATTSGDFPGTQKLVYTVTTYVPVPTPTGVVDEPE